MGNCSSKKAAPEDSSKKASPPPEVGDAVPEPPTEAEQPANDAANPIAELPEDETKAKPVVTESMPPPPAASKLSSLCCAPAPLEGPVARADGMNYDAKRKDVEKIICPCMATLYANGDLETDANGCATQEQLKVALMRTGLRSEALLGALSSAAADGPLNIFEMNGTKVEHSFSSGIRDPAPSPERFDELLKFSDNGKFTTREFSRAIEYFRKNPNDVNADVTFAALDGGTDFQLTAGGLIEVFGRDGGEYLTDEDLRGIYLHAKYPEGWTVREWGMLDAAGKLIEIKAAKYSCGIM